jgi:hypothetical protein
MLTQTTPNAQKFAVIHLNVDMSAQKGKKMLQRIFLTKKQEMKVAFPAIN